MIHIFHQIQGFKGVAHGDGANKNKEDFHGIVSPILNSQIHKILIDKISMFEPNHSWVKILLDFSLEFGIGETMS